MSKKVLFACIWIEAKHQRKRKTKKKYITDIEKYVWYTYYTNTKNNSNDFLIFGIDAERDYVRY